MPRFLPPAGTVMRVICYLALVLFALVPALALAQDMVYVEVAGVEHLAYGAAFGERFPQPGTNIGPLPIVPVEGTGETAPPEQGCDPIVNVDEVEGNIAFILRGTCTFVLKVQNAVAAGAVAAVVYDDTFSEEDLVLMSGDCEPADGCTIPAAFVSRSSGLTILAELDSGPTDATLIPLRVYQPPTGGTHNTGLVQFDVFDQGFLGTDARFDGTGFVFDGVNGLFVSSVLVGVDGEVVSSVRVTYS